MDPNRGGHHLQPESLIYRFADKRFLGLPRDPRRLDAFRAACPHYDHVLWHHSFSVQEEMLQALLKQGARPVRNAHNPGGHPYTVLRLPDPAFW